MAFGMSKTPTRRREFNELPGEWIGWIEPGIEMEGKMKVGAGLFRLNAHFKGDIAAEGTVVIHDQGEIEGRVQAKVVSVTGKVKGEVHASERLEIKEHGILLGNIFTPCLMIDPGGFFDGECHMPTPEPAASTTEATPAAPELKVEP